MKKTPIQRKAGWIREIQSLYLEEHILKMFHARLNQVGMQDCNNESVVLDMKLLKYDRDMMRYILEFIGHAKTIINFACACRRTFEVFKQANANNELIKRLARDLGLIIFVSPINNLFI